MRYFIPNMFTGRKNSRDYLPYTIVPLHLGNSSLLHLQCPNYLPDSQPAHLNLSLSYCSRNSRELIRFRGSGSKGTVRRAMPRALMF